MIKRYYRLDEAAKFLASKHNEIISETDVLEIAMRENLRLCWRYEGNLYFRCGYYTGFKGCLQIPNENHTITRGITKFAYALIVEIFQWENRLKEYAKKSDNHVYMPDEKCTNENISCTTFEVNIDNCLIPAKDLFYFLSRNQNDILSGYYLETRNEKRDPLLSATNIKITPKDLVQPAFKSLHTNSVKKGEIPKKYICINEAINYLESEHNQNIDIRDIQEIARNGSLRLCVLFKGCVVLSPVSDYNEYSYKFEEPELCFPSFNGYLSIFKKSIYPGEEFISHRALLVVDIVDDDHEFFKDFFDCNSPKFAARQVIKTNNQETGYQYSNFRYKYCDVFVPNQDLLVYSARIKKLLTIPTSEQAKAESTEKTIRGIEKRQVMTLFNGIKWDYEHWGKNLATPSKKLVDCRLAKGSKRESARWSPVEIGLYLLDEGISLKKLDAVFVRLPDWVDEWREKTDLERI